MEPLSELTCYVWEGWQPLIRPASHKRDWMDATTDRFAYRCLPLAIANAHGWEILSPVGFSARWTGGNGVDAVEIRADAGSKDYQVPVSLFGYGTFTFHIEGLIRTSPGWNIWVGGPPNEARDGVAPLGGVIETDWSPYSFTMNWRFTRPNHWVRFEVGDPFCFFFPVPRGAMDGIEPVIRPIDDEPGLRDTFKAWSVSRDAHQTWVRETKPTAPADHWQKLYYRGVSPDGQPGIDDHQSKLRLAAFADLRPPEQRPEAGCPVHGGAAAGEQTAPAAARGTYPPPSPEAVVARRDWMLKTIQRQQSLSRLSGGLPRFSELADDDFLEHFYAPGRPCIIEGGARGWSALDRWTPDYLKSRVGSAEIEFQGGRETDPLFELLKDRHKRRMPFDQFIDAITGQTSNDAYITAYNSDANRTALAPLDADLGHASDYLTPGGGMMWIGPEGTFTPLHCDLTNNMLVQIIGRKKLTLVPPSETGRLANHRHVFSDVHDLKDPQRLARYPDAAGVGYFDVEIGPGDMLYIPVGWWHQVTSLSFSVMLTYTNFRWPNDAYETFPAG